MLINKKQLSADVQYAANRVPVLDSKVAHLEEEITRVLHYKGTVDTYAELPSSGNKIGDVWNIRQADSEHEIKAGDNVAWDGSDWDVLGGAGAGAPTLLRFRYDDATDNHTTIDTGLDLSGARIIKVYKNGLLLEETPVGAQENSDYTISGNSIIFTSAIEENTKVAVEVF
jgi:hypothetical protein